MDYGTKKGIGEKEGYEKRVNNGVEEREGREKGGKIIREETKKMEMEGRGKVGNEREKKDGRYLKKERNRWQ